MPSVVEDAHAVLLPAFAGTLLSDSVKRYLDAGGVTILLGESREEYVARQMSEERRSSETAELLQTVTEEARKRSGTLLAAVDQEMGGICRLHGLVPQFPDRERLSQMSADEIEDIARRVAECAVGMGINVFLAPVLDIVAEGNVWLKGRNWSTDPDKVAALSAAYIRGAQAGGVAATAKHFPGYATTTGDPAIDPQAVTLQSRQELEMNFQPFRSAIAAGVEMIMVGPAIVSALDPHKAALRSPIVIDLLKKDLGFNGIVMADDLDALAVLRGDSVETAAIDALNAGCDLLLLADTGGQLRQVSDAIASAVDQGALDRAVLASAAQKVRALASAYDTTGRRGV